MSVDLVFKYLLLKLKNKINCLTKLSFFIKNTNFSLLASVIINQY